MLIGSLTLSRGFARRQCGLAILGQGFRNLHGGVQPGTLENQHHHENQIFSSKFKDPEFWYRSSKVGKREIIFHCGPTNSGKTFAAMERLKNSKKGVYASPLRMLAWQVARDLDCNLVTGQEKELKDKSSIVSCTVEMCDVEREQYEVAVIDEIQLLSDKDRGMHFTRALLGLNVKELHLCGTEPALHLVQQICDLTGEDLTVKRYERLAPLVVADEPIHNSANVKPGDCVVAFSRRKLYELKDVIERSAKLPCVIIYGQLPPETRKYQADLFNKGKSVLIASDAIGLGLNLKINRVVFSDTRKFDGYDIRPLTESEIKQIAGRAGRFGHTESGGVVTSLYRDQLEAVREGIEADPAPLEVAFIFPPTSMFNHVIAKVIKERLTSFKENRARRVRMLMKNVLDKREDKDAYQDALRELKRESKRISKAVGMLINRSLLGAFEELETANADLFENHIFRIPKVTSRIAAINALHHIPLQLQTLISLSEAPIQPNNEYIMDTFKDYASQLQTSTRQIIQSLGDPDLIKACEIFAEMEEILGHDLQPREEIHLPLPIVKTDFQVRSQRDLQDLETIYNVLDLSLWLSQHFTHHNEVEKEFVTEERKKCIERIRAGLNRLQRNHTNRPNQNIKRNFGGQQRNNNRKQRQQQQRQPK